ncbi:hypothetical protein PM082_009882 [Marasmius tenuissimus]|nr:hypothetical protein PM082_009882 [Marasmius tenuissimus]
MVKRIMGYLEAREAVGGVWGISVGGGRGNKGKEGTRLDERDALGWKEDNRP